MPLYDFECKCGKTTEAITDIYQQKIECKCGDVAERIISASGQYCSNEDADWIKSVADVVNKKSENPATREFLEHPTRTNLRRHLESSGLRHAEPGEKFGPLKKPFDVDKHTERLIKERQRKNVIEVR